MLTHVKELIEQNAQKLLLHWPEAPLGIYSAGIGRKELGRPITFAGIQSVRGKAEDIGHTDLCIIDECHTVGHTDEGGYRRLIADLESINPNLRVIGLTATPYRLGHGMITDKPAVFDDLISPVSIEQLVGEGYLAPLRSKATRTRLSVEGVHKRGGEFIERELQRAVDVHETSEAVIDEVITLAGKRKAWLFFCTGVEHARHVKDILKCRGIKAACITGETPAEKRDEILSRYKAGEIRAVTNANVLTTGFDYPDIDLIVMMRPTMSPGLYVQMAGRGMRVKSHTDHCLVLDFAGVVQMHGPITCVQPPFRELGPSRDGVAPAKVCPYCEEIIPAQCGECSACGFSFLPPAPEPKQSWQLREDDIMGGELESMDVTRWRWDEHVSRKNGKEMLKVTYYGILSDRPVREYLCVLHDGYAGYKAMETLKQIGSLAGVDIDSMDTTEEVCEAMNKAFPPITVKYKKDGAFFRIMAREFGHADVRPTEDYDEYTEQAYCM